MNSDLSLSSPPNDIPKKLFSRLSGWLSENTPLWAERPFVGLPVCWEKDYPDVARFLRSLTLDEIEALETAPAGRQDLPGPFREWARESEELSRWPLLKRKPLPGLNARPRGVPARKWDQVRYFAEAVMGHPRATGGDWLDWCAGKGHLGRTLSEITSRDVDCIETDSALCDSGRRMADDSTANPRFVCADVMAGDGVPSLSKGNGVVALHACGQLHMRLMQLAVEQAAGFLAIAPCCYHRIEQDTYPPMSSAGIESGLVLHRHHLRLLAFDEVVASSRRRKMRRREQAWRLALDLLIRQATGEDRYHPLGPVPRAWLREPFTGFCKKLSRRENLPLPARWDADEAEKHGWERLGTVRALGLVRGLFRRPLESWLILDRVLFLAEAGYRVSAGVFCPPGITPRNLLILASADETIRPCRADPCNG